MVPPRHSRTVEQPPGAGGTGRVGIRHGRDPRQPLDVAWRQAMLDRTRDDKQDRDQSDETANHNRKALVLRAGSDGEPAGGDQIDDTGHEKRRCQSKTKMPECVVALDEGGVEPGLSDKSRHLHGQVDIRLTVADARHQTARPLRRAGRQTDSIPESLPMGLSTTTARWRRRYWAAPWLAYSTSRRERPTVTRRGVNHSCGARPIAPWPPASRSARGRRRCGAPACARRSRARPTRDRRARRR